MIENDSILIFVKENKANLHAYRDIETEKASKKFYAAGFRNHHLLTS